MKLSVKKTFSMLMLVFMLAIVLAIPAFAAATNYQFLDANGNYSPHATAFTYDAVISGSTVTVHYDSAYVNGLKVYNAATGLYDTIPGTVSGSYIYFTFDVNDFDSYLPVKLGVNAGPHSGDLDLLIEWLL
jgi:YbbR domain-containing protein